MQSTCDDQVKSRVNDHVNDRVRDDSDAHIISFAEAARARDRAPTRHVIPLHRRVALPKRLTEDAWWLCFGAMKRPAAILRFPFGSRRSPRSEDGPMPRSSANVVTLCGRTVR